MAKRTGIKGKIALVIIIFAASAVGLFGGIWQTGIYSDLTKNCTAEVTGVVDEELRYDETMTDSVETKYVTGRPPIYRHRFYGWERIGSRWIIHIDVQTDELFKTENIYADIGTEKVGDTVIIHYAPDDPTHYYIGDRAIKYRDAGIFSFVMGGFMFVIAVLVAIFVHYAIEVIREQDE